MNYKQIASRLTGISCPVFGVSWNPPATEVDVAQRVLSFLEDRRVLYNEYEMELPDHCMMSVIDIRRFLTDVLGRLPNKQGLPAHLRMMRAACRQFLDKNGGERFRDHQPHMFGGPETWVFASALGDLRTTIGLHVGIVCTMYGLGVEGDLAKILPPLPNDDNEEADA